MIPARSKYGAIRTEYRSTQGFARIYDSKLEANHAATLDLLIRAGEVARWLPQVPIPLPGGVKLVVDFLVWPQGGGEPTWQDCKGTETQASKNKRKQTKDLFGIDVEIVRR